MYDVRYPPPAPKKSGWGYTYASIVEEHCCSKVQGGSCQGRGNEIIAPNKRDRTIG